ncbi:asparagine synthase (glutamine-hydrolyzing) [Phosphitispora sp. TUW77]|uniref:asparagine synthase (glutamine-hydrolyzing) n=1 Tax=Phosphitispora sp. TUW77 TaxID=3152361 RepID=UPI003AB90A95
MCGITGWIDWQRNLKFEKPVLEEMTKTLARRGPDAKGFWLSTNAALGHRRLAVVDPVGGTQPMRRKRGKHEYIIIYNGELYNTTKLRQELESLGHVFYGYSDTEVLLNSYIEWGPACLEKLNGIFAFAVWNETDQKLFLARDRLGVKPLFYTERRHSILFASELKALLAHPAISPELDIEGLSEIIVLGPARTPGHGIFRGVKELKPGYFLLYDKRGIRIKRYWQLESKPHEDNLKTTIEKTRQLLVDAIRSQLVADVPVCTFLSGGVDSSAITSVAAELYRSEGKKTLNTYSIDYISNDSFFKPGKYQPNSDSDWVQYVSEFLNTSHNSIYFDTPDLVEALGIAVTARDLPGMADIDSSLYLFCREIKKKHTVALSGECADEIFGGYPWYCNVQNWKKNTFPWIAEIDTKMNVFSPELLELLKPANYMANRCQATVAETPLLPGESPQEIRMRQMFYLNFHWFMQTLLERKDRMSMATGLEVRVPFCDHRIIEYVWNIPWEIKNCDNIEKGLLRRALKGIIPEGVLYRRKSPYPKTHNPNYLAAVRKSLLDIISDPTSPIIELVNLKNIRKMAAANADTFDRPWFGQLMTGPQLFAYLIQIDIWLRKYKIRII